MSAAKIYGGFWRRLGSLFLDILFLSPLTIFVFWGSSHWRQFNLWYFVPGTLFGIFYQVILVKRLGGTPGKVVAGLRIAKVDLSPIGYREAILRFLPEFVIGTILSIGFLIATSRMTDDEYLGVGFMKRSVMIVALTPVWAKPLQWLHNIWVWSEFFVLLTNEKRRAIHDFIAGTVVLIRSKEYNSEASLPPVLAPLPTDHF